MIGSGKAVKSMLLVSPTGQMYEHICELLPNDEFDPIVNVSSAGEARRILSSTDFDLLVVNAPLTDEFGVDFVQNYVETPIDIRVVDRAKWLLIGNLNMTENDAHYYIEKQAMNSRLSRREVAEHIIRTYDK